jgi:hypothetical protein
LDCGNRLCRGALNCVHGKAWDIEDPNQNIRHDDSPPGQISKSARAAVD